MTRKSATRQGRYGLAADTTASIELERTEFAPDELAMIRLWVEGSIGRAG